MNVCELESVQAACPYERAVSVECTVRDKEIDVKSSSWFKNAMCLATAGLLMAAGCANDRGEGAAAIETPDDRKTAPSETWTGPKTEPAPAPAPAPKPVIEKCAMAFPTGDMASSAILVRKNLPAEVVAGQPFDYEIIVQNLTNGSLDNVVLTDNMSSNFKLNASNPQADASGAVVKWNLGTLAPRESKTIKANATATGGVGTISGCAAVTYANSLCCNIAVVQPALKLVKTQPADANLCDAIPVVLVVTNTGSGPARNVKVVDNLPAGLTSDGKTNLSFDAGTLAAGQSREFRFTAKAGKNGAYSNTATATAEGGLSASAQAGTTFRQPILAVKAECPGNNLIGRELTFKYTVTNSGDMACSNTVVSASVPGSFVSADAGGTSGGGMVNWNVGNLGPNESKTFTAKVRSSGAGTLNTSVTARCGSCSCCPEAKANCSVNISGSPDIGTTVTDNDGLPLVGDNHTYDLEVKNQGQVPLTNVKMVVTVPAEFTFVSSAANPQVAGNKFTFNFGNLAPGQTARAQVTIKSSKSGEFVVIGETTATEIKLPIRDDEFTNVLDR